MQYDILDWILEQKEDISGKTWNPNNVSSLVNDTELVLVSIHVTQSCTMLSKNSLWYLCHSSVNLKYFQNKTPKIKQEKPNSCLYYQILNVTGIGSGQQMNISS